jgi:alpha-beta hydrolase superfamily lysophospholipase
MTGRTGAKSWSIALSRHLATISLLALAAGQLTAARADTLAALPRADGASVTVRLAGNWSGGNCPPTLILSHGLGGNQTALDYVVKAGLAEGYRVLAMAHAESGPRALFRVMATADKEAMLLSPDIWRGRALDLDAALARATQTCRPARLVLGGHSMGAALVMLEAGAVGRPPYTGRRRFDAYIAVSPQGIGWAFADARAWRTVTSPVLMLTGTRDSGLDGDWRTRLAAFAGLPPGMKRLAIIEGATHLALGGRGSDASHTTAGRVAAEFLRDIRTGWGRSRLAADPGLEIREK